MEAINSKEARVYFRDWFFSSLFRVSGVSGEMTGVGMGITKDNP